MLERITISDFIIVERLELDILPGLTVLTGETGAGKSILLDALGFVLGERSDATTVRPGAERADVAAIFAVGSRAEVVAWLREHDLDAANECILRRTVSTDGRSRGTINGNPVPIQQLRELGELLVDIHGQSAHQWLLKPTAQRVTLDDYAAHAPMCAAVAAHYAGWSALNDKIARLSASTADRAARRELLQFQVEELTALELGANEVDELDQELARLGNASRLLQGAEQALQVTDSDDDTAVAPALDRISTDLESLARVDPALRASAELFSGAAIQLREAARELRSYRDALDLDPARLSAVEERIAAIHAIARKHRVDPKELPALTARLTSELAELESAGANLDELHNELAHRAAQYRSVAQTLSDSRKLAAGTLSAVVTRSIHTLGMRGGVFNITIAADPDQFAPHGFDHVEFLVSANPGQPPRPLGKVASGGELSRISLAIEVATAQTNGIPTLVFDEVDAGVGGGVAEIVGRKLRALAKHRQIICVTHLPQVAAQGDQHWTVTKTARNGAARSSIAVLSDDDRIDEIARMLGGVKVTTQTKSHAREMLNQARG